MALGLIIYTQKTFKKGFFDPNKKWGTKRLAPQRANGSRTEQRSIISPYSAKWVEVDTPNPASIAADREDARTAKSKKGQL